MIERRYVVLHHTGIGEPHYDLLFEWECDDRLTSFRCLAWPPEVGDRFEERPDHRPIYLTFEGALGSDRGTVARVESGTIVHEVIASDPPTIALRLDGRTITLANRIDGDSMTTWVVLATA